MKGKELIPQRLILTGAEGISKGLDLDSIDIDFTQFKPGVVALTGRNGLGKTTIIENMIPFRTLLSRSGKLISHFQHLDECKREYHFSYNNINYISFLIFYPNRSQQNQLAYLYKNGTPINDGTTVSYDSKVEEIFGSLNLFKYTVFSAQKSEKIGSMRRADKKDLFIELLNLGIYSAYEKFAKEKRDIISTIVNVKSQQIKDLERILFEKNQVIVDFDNVNKALETNKTLVINLKNSYQKEEKKLSELRLKVLLADEKNKALERLKNNLQELQEGFVKYKNDFTSNINRLEKSLTIYNTRLEDTTKFTRDNSLEDLQLNYNNALQWKQLYDSLLKSNTQATEIYQSVLHDKEVRYSELQIEIKNLEEKLKQTLTIENANIPCSTIDQGMKNNCPAFTSYLHEDSNVLTHRLNQSKKSLQQLFEEIVVHNEQIEKLKVDPNKLSKAKNNAEFVPQTRDALTRYEETEKQIQLIKKQIEDHKNEIKIREEEFENRRSEAESKEKQLIIDIKTTREEIPKDIKAVQFAYDNLQEVQAVTQHSIEKTQKILNSLHQECGQLQTKINQVRSAETNLEILKKETQQNRKDSTEWNLVVDACNRAGIPTLEISQAGPEITQIANDLLIECFDSPFTVTFETLSPKADGKGYKESFEIMVHRGNEQVTIDKLSGGEEVWIQQALIEAMGVYSKLYANNNFLTAFCDESDGSLDVVNRMSYYKMRLKVHELCNLQYTFYITHDPMVINSIPQRINLSKETGVKVEV